MREISLPVFLALAGVAMAQESINYGSIGGRVTDASGGAIEGAHVIARQVETNLKSLQETDREGRFRFPYLRVGNYEVKIWRQGFAEAGRSVQLGAGSAFELPVSLAIGAMETAVNVSGEGSLLETARTQIAGTVTHEELQALPLNGRNFLDLTLLVPGVSPTNTGSNQLFAETSAAPGQGISIGSQRNFSNNFIVDGLSGNDDAAGLSGIFYGLDVVSELQVVTSGGQAEFGRAMGGYVSVVTKSGTNAVHGDVYGYFRSSRFNAANALSHTVLPLTQAQDGGSVGGPVRRDRTFYFVNFERRDLNQSGLITIDPANVATINGKLAAAGYSGPAIYTGLYPNPVHNSNFLGKLDHQFNAKDQGSIRYSLYDVDSANSRGAGGISAASASAGLTDADHTIAAGNIATLSPRVVNETRAQFTRSNLAAPPSDPVGPAVAIAGVAAFGTLSSSPTARRNSLYEVVDNLSGQVGAHAIRAGADFLYNDDAITFPRSIRGSYSFASLAGFLTGVYNNAGFTQTFNASTVSQANPNIGIYAQDEWKATSRLTFNFGLRYDLQFLETISTDRNNVSPRAGFAWSPFASRNTVVRGSFGLFYDRVPLRALANALLSANNTVDPANLRQISISLSPAQTGAPAFPNILPSLTLPAGVLFNFTTMDRRMQNAYSGQGSLEIEHRLTGRSTISIGYEHLRGVHLLASVNQNVPGCAALGNNNGCRPNPSFGNDSQYSPAGDSRYDGLDVSFVQRPSSWSSYRVSYTWSKALNDVGEFFFSAPMDNFNIWRDYGRSDDDQRHRVVVSGSIHSSLSKPKTAWQWASHGFEFSGTLQYYSALPFNITTGSNTIQGTAARPTVNGSFIGRNTGRGFDFLNVNARLSRSFAIGDRVRLQWMAEAFNLLNHRNGLTLNGTFGNGTYPSNPLPAYGQITSVSDPRTLQVAVRTRF